METSVVGGTLRCLQIAKLPEGKPSAVWFVNQVPNAVVLALDTLK